QLLTDVVRSARCFRLIELDTQSFTPIDKQSIYWPLAQHQIADWNEHACLECGAERCAISIGKRPEHTGHVDLQSVSLARERQSTGRDGLQATEVSPGVTIDVADAFAAQFEHRLAALSQNPCNIVIAELQRELRSVAATAGAHETVGLAPEI